MKRLIILFKKFILNSFLLYGFNLISVNFNMIIPINLFTIFVVSILGIPSMLGLIIFKLLFLWGVFYGTKCIEETFL